MSYDMEPVYEAAARGWLDCVAPVRMATKNDPYLIRLHDVPALRAAVDASRPLIEAAVRAEIAAKIERAAELAESQTEHDGHRIAARIARGETSGNG